MSSAFFVSTVTAAEFDTSMSKKTSNPRNQLHWQTGHLHQRLSYLSVPFLPSFIPIYSVSESVTASDFEESSPCPVTQCFFNPHIQQFNYLNSPAIEKERPGDLFIPIARIRGDFYPLVSHSPWASAPSSTTAMAAFVTRLMNSKSSVSLLS